MPFSYAVVAKSNGRPPTNPQPPEAATSTMSSEHDPVFDLLSIALSTNNSFKPVWKCYAQRSSPGELYNTVFTVKAIPPRLYTNSYPRFYEITRLGPKPRHKPIVASVQVKVDHDGKSLLARKDMEWTDLATGLLPAFPPADGDVLGIGSTLWHQSYLWAISGKQFHLLALPRELRDMIYDACSTFTYPFHWSYGWNFMTNECRTKHRFNNAFEPSVKAEFFRRGRILNGAGPAMSLLLLNKQVSREFKELLWKSMDFRFTDPYCLKRFASVPLARLHSSTSLYTVSKVFIHLETSDWLVAFGIPHRQTYGIHAFELTPFVQALRNSKISHLTMNIEHEERSRAISFGYSLFNTCTKIIRALLLWYARDHVKHIPEVRIEGCIESSMSEKFQQMLLDERMGKTSSITEYDFFGSPDQLLQYGYTSWLKVFPWNPDRCPWNVGMCALVVNGDTHRCRSGAPACTKEQCISELRP